MRAFNGVEELEKAGGPHLGHSEWHIITQDQINAFAAATGDDQWIHVDPATAADGPFSSTIAHGFLTLSLLPMLTWQVHKVEGVKMGVNYGAEKLRFRSPVRVDSPVMAGVELTAVSPNSLGYQVATRVTIVLDGAAKPACVVDMLAVVVP